ncbi:MAG: hypothetical protein LBG45_09755 [Dysgonamonadaceae bacterium]|nr:hypothetical protein [Dysgonamonadaceae bacterium]
MTARRHESAKARKREREKARKNITKGSRLHPFVLSYFRAFALSPFRAFAPLRQPPQTSGSVRDICGSRRNLPEAFRTFAAAAANLRKRSGHLRQPP